MNPILIVSLVVLGIFVITAIVWKPVRDFARQIQVEHAREAFRLQRERLQHLFFEAASATGKPRGLRWQELQWEPDVQLARDKHSKQIVGLVGVTIQFEAIEGSDMEGHSEVGHLRNASAVFFFHRGEWQTIGKTLFNMNPDEALQRFEQQYDAIEDE